MGFGPTMHIERNGLGVTLQAPRISDIPLFAIGFSSMRVHLYTSGFFAQSEENEREWYERNRKTEDSIIWTIKPDESDEIVGVTSLHGIQSFSGTCTSGIVIFNTDWWGKGLATTTHHARTYFAAKYLNRNTIKSSVRNDNIPSRKALEKVGYGVTGCEPFTGFRDGRFLSSLNMIWINPDRISILCPNGIKRQYLKQVERARIALEFADENIRFE